MVIEKGKRTVIGWREYISLPGWGIRKVRAKIDTGAKTSAIHVREIIPMRDGKIRFEVVTRERPRRKIIWVTARPVRQSVVKSSHGLRQSRFVCRTELRLGAVSKQIEISLVCRKGMLCRMLVGRSAIDEHFVVDPSRKYIFESPDKTTDQKSRKK